MNTLQSLDDASTLPSLTTLVLLGIDAALAIAPLLSSDDS